MATAPEYPKPPPYTPTAAPGQAVPNSVYPGYPPGYQPYPNQQAPVPGVYVPAYGSTTTVTVQPREMQQNIIIVGACPACRVGVLQSDFTCLGIFCCIVFFPLGIICCLMMRSRRCSNCGAYFG